MNQGINQQRKTKLKAKFNSPSRGLTRPELFQSNEASGTVSVFTCTGCNIDVLTDSVEDWNVVVCGFVGSMGLKLMLAAKRGILDEADAEAH